MRRSLRIGLLLAAALCVVVFLSVPHEKPVAGLDRTAKGGVTVLAVV
jgi:hypothetical protein